MNVGSFYFHLLLYGIFLPVNIASECDEDWQAYKDKCYWVNGDEAVYFPEAINICKRRNSSRLYFGSEDDMSFLKEYKYYTRRYHSIDTWMSSVPGSDDIRVEGFNNSLLEISRNTKMCPSFSTSTMLLSLYCNRMSRVVCKKDRNDSNQYQQKVQRTTAQVFPYSSHIRNGLPPYKIFKKFKVLFDSSTPRRLVFPETTPPITEYVLTKPQPPLFLQAKCRAGDLLILGSCYHLGNDEMLTWQQASDYCKKYSNGYLFSINSRRELEKVMNQITWEIWLGLTYLQDDKGSSSASFFRWASGERNTFFWWWEVNLDVINSSHCFSTFPRTSGQVMDVLNGKNCSHKTHFICEYNRRTDSQDYEEVRGSCISKGWHYDAENRMCVKYVKTYAKWKEAEWTCQSGGGHLSNYFQDRAIFRFENLRHKLNIKERYFWTGVYVEANHEFSWSGGEKHIKDYTSHNKLFISKEKIFLNKEYCIIYDSNTNNIINYSCDAYLHFLCIAKEHESRKSLRLPTLPSFERCNDRDWFRFKNSCYKVHGEETDVVSHNTAAKNCENEGAALASIGSYSENKWILSLVSQHPASEFWIGGIRRYSNFYWADDVPFVYTHWNDGEPNNHKGREDCISFYTKMGGMWNDEWCITKNRFICKKAERISNFIGEIDSSNSSRSNIPIKTDEEIIGKFDQIYNLDEKENQEYSFCGGEWLRMGNRCIYIGNISLTFDASIKYCQSLHPYGNLISIHSMEDQATLNSWMRLKVNNVWIGLTKTSRGNYIWMDESENDFQYWAGLPETQSSISCVESKGLPSYGGKWSPISCYAELPPACSKPYNESEQTVKYCSPPYDIFIEENGICYFLVEDKKTWMDAEKFCISKHSHLVSIEDYVDQTYIWYKSFVIADQDIWIGLKSEQQDMENIDKENPYKKWSNSQYVLYTNWARNEPLFSSQHHCSALDIQSGKWVVHPCHKEKAFICKHNAGKIPNAISQETGNCPGAQWSNYGGKFCYYFENTDRLPWNEASRWCKRQGAHLASIHSNEENYMLSSFVRSTDLPSWIGLHRTLVDDFVWSDNTTKDFEAWGTDEPSTNANEQCAELNEERKWNDIDCSNIRSFMCKAQKTLPPTFENRKESALSSISSILITLSVLLFLIGGIAYLTFRKLSVKSNKNVELTNRMSLGKLESTTIYSNISEDEDI